MMEGERDSEANTLPVREGVIDTDAVMLLVCVSLAVDEGEVEGVSEFVGE